MLASGSKLSRLVVAVGLLAVSVIAPGSAEGESAPIQWRETLVTVESELTAIEGYERHAVGRMRQRGFAFYADDTVATVEAWLVFERAGGETSYRGYAVYALPDGSTKMARFTGTGDPRGEQAGEFVFQAGTGKYEGITGEGAFAGRGFAPHGDIYLDVSGSYSVP